jgi:hypothetical protein
MRCLAPRSLIKSPLIIATDPFAKPIASWERSSRAAKADIYPKSAVADSRSLFHRQPNMSLTGNGLRAFCTVTVERHRGAPVFFSVLSSAHTFNTGSLGRSSAIVTRRDVPSICFI